MKTSVSTPMTGISEDLLSSFQFRFRNWDSLSVYHPPFITEPFCLTRQDHEYLVQTVERLHPLMVKSRESISGSSQLMNTLGLDSWTQEAISQEFKSINPNSNIEIARYDFFKTVGGRWMISEINNDVPSGYNESSCMQMIGQKFWRGIGKFQFPTLITEVFADTIKRRNFKKAAMVYGTAYSEDLQVCLFLKDHLESSSLKINFASPSHLKISQNKAVFWGEAVDVIYRMYPVEWFSALPNRDDWVKALCLPGLRIINPFSTIISQSKNLFSMLHTEHSNLLSESDWAWIQQFIPYTEAFASEKASVYLEEKDRWVLKPIFGRMGYDVAIGKLLTSEQWQKALSEALKKPGQYCIQECFDIAPVSFSLADCYLCVGIFVINSHFSGYFTRASLTPLTTYEAMDVTTVIELS